MPDKHIQFEAKKHSLRQSQDGSVTISLNIHPNDVDPRLLTAPMGKVFQVVMVDPDDVLTEKPKRELSLSQIAAIISQDPKWLEYANAAFITRHFTDGVEAMRDLCEVKSRSEIKENTPAGDKFIKLRNQFNDYQKYEVI